MDFQCRVCNTEHDKENMGMVLAGRRYCFDCVTEAVRLCEEMAIEVENIDPHQKLPGGQAAFQCIICEKEYKNDDNEMVINDKHYCFICVSGSVLLYEESVIEAKKEMLAKLHSPN